MSVPHFDFAVVIIKPIARARPRCGSDRLQGSDALTGFLLHLLLGRVLGFFRLRIVSQRLGLSLQMGHQVSA
jgi:hypothetical protein